MTKNVKTTKPYSSDMRTKRKKKYLLLFILLSCLLVLLIDTALSFTIRTYVNEQVIEEFYSLIKISTFFFSLYPIVVITVLSLNISVSELYDRIHLLDETVETLEAVIESSKNDTESPHAE